MVDIQLFNRIFPYLKNPMTTERRSQCRT